MIRFLRTEKGCVFGDRSSMGVVRCPTSRFASVVPAAAAPSAASIALRSMGSHRTFALCYVPGCKKELFTHDRHVSSPAA